ncbi:MAG: hypothetical protein K5Q00_02850 [Gammaproteobacteria bacterium]|nr:hypothetical protein [Gammaproteobacteria bacterium]
MDALNIHDLLETMLKAAKQSLAQQWPRSQEYTESNLKTIARSIMDIATLHAEQKIDADQAKLDLDIAKNTAEMTLITSAGLSELMAAQAINAALSAVKTVVNKSLGFALL